MNKKIKDISEITKFLIATQIAFVIGYCTVKGIDMQKEFWALAGSILTYIFITVTPQAAIAMRSNIGAWFRNLIAFSLVAIIGWCTIIGQDIGKELWGIIGSVITFIFNHKNQID